MVQPVASRMHSAALRMCAIIINGVCLILSTFVVQLKIRHLKLHTPVDGAVGITVVRHQRLALAVAYARQT